MKPVSEIPGDVREALRLAAMDASTRSYSPYSSYPVGAAVLTQSGRIVSGTNIENASFGLTVCAERVAVFGAIAAAKKTVEGDSEIVAVHIYVPANAVAFPCGACRQVLNQFGPAMHVFATCGGDGVAVTTLDALLPNAFGPHNLPDKPSATAADS